LCILIKLIEKKLGLTTWNPTRPKIKYDKKRTWLSPAQPEIRDYPILDDPKPEPKWPKYPKPDLAQPQMTRDPKKPIAFDLKPDPT
jgi:hypothetical protein